MSTIASRLIISLAALTALTVGCATAEDEQEADDPSSAAVNVSINDDVMPAPAGEDDHDEANGVADANVSSVGINSSGLNCACPTGQQFQNGLCYPACQSGWVGEGPVCWKPCAATFTDTGWFCQRNSKVIKSNTSSCPWYNKCGLGSSCSKCPAGYSNDGCTCRIDAYIYAQPSYGRGAGTTPSCSAY